MRNIYLLHLIFPHTYTSSLFKQQITMYKHKKPPTMQESENSECLKSYLEICTRPTHLWWIICSMWMRMLSIWRSYQGIIPQVFSKGYPSYRIEALSCHSWKHQNSTNMKDIKLIAIVLIDYWIMLANITLLSDHTQC